MVPPDLLNTTGQTDEHGESGRHAHHQRTITSE